MKQKELEQKIEALELDEMDETQIEKVVSALSTEGIEIRKKRKKIRYRLYRIQTETLGGAASGEKKSFKDKFEKQSNFGGWRFFGINWDVSMEDPFRCVSRVRSVGEEWDELVKAKFPTVHPGGKVEYPDINVRKKVEANAKKNPKK